MKQDVTQRIKQYLKTNRYTIRAVSQKLNVNEGTLTNKLNGTRTIDLEIVCSLLKLFPDLSAEWLLLGYGPMLRTKEYIMEPIHYNQVNDDGDNIAGYGNTVNKDNSRVVALLEQQLEEEKARSREYWNTIQQLIKK